MKLGIMQPYIFPYIGYFQLINAVDKFVFYDDVNFIKQGWINRNRILLNGKDHLFTIPVKDVSSFRLINEAEIDQKSFPQWKKKFYKTVTAAYSKAPNYSQINELIIKILDTPASTISEVGKNSIIEIAKNLQLQTFFILSSTLYDNAHLKAQERVIDICKKEQATEYLNASGGSELYSKISFKKENIELSFIKTKHIIYKQLSEHFVPNLSIIDALMFNTKEQISQFLNSYDLV